MQKFKAFMSPKNDIFHFLCKLSGVFSKKLNLGIAFFKNTCYNNLCKKYLLSEGATSAETV